MDNDAYNLFFAIGRCHGLLKEHAVTIGLRPGVRKVKHYFNMYNIVDAFRLEEYVDADLSDGQAIGWCLELTLSLEGISVEADVRKYHDGGQDLLVEIADGIHLSVQESPRLPDITRQLCGAYPI